MTPEQTLDWLAQQHWDQCREDRPIQDWIRKMRVRLPKQEQGEPSRAERLLAHVEDFAKRCGWSKESGEGAFECVQRTSYAQGVEDEKLQRKQEQGEPVAAKHMREWVDYLKRKSDHGQHMQIPSEMSAGACWELAIDLEQFINTTPQQRTWAGLSLQEQAEILASIPDVPFEGEWHAILFSTVESKLKEKNT